MSEKYTIQLLQDVKRMILQLSCEVHVNFLKWTPQIKVSSCDGYSNIYSGGYHTIQFHTYLSCMLVRLSWGVSVSYVASGSSVLPKLCLRTILSMSTYRFPHPLLHVVERLCFCLQPNSFFPEFHEARFRGSLWEHIDIKATFDKS